MDLIPWNRKRRGSLEPMEHSLARFHDEIDRVFDRFYHEPFALSLSPLDWTRGAFPRLDIAESDEHVTVTVELPGMKAEDVEIDVTGNMLTLRGEKREEKEEKGRDYRYTERQFGSFSRTVQLPSTVDAEKVDASFKDGVLTIKLERRPEARPRKIKVRTES
jgi:HSP20 family protein